MKSLSVRMGKRLLLAAAVMNGMLTSCVADLVESSSASRCDLGEVCCSLESVLAAALSKKGHSTQRINVEHGVRPQYEGRCREGAQPHAAVLGLFPYSPARRPHMCQQGWPWLSVVGPSASGPR